MRIANLHRPRLAHFASRPLRPWAPGLLARRSERRIPLAEYVKSYAAILEARLARVESEPRFVHATQWRGVEVVCFFVSPERVQQAHGIGDLSAFEAAGRQLEGIYLQKADTIQDQMDANLGRHFENVVIDGDVEDFEMRLDVYPGRVGQKASGFLVVIMLARRETKDAEPGELLDHVWKEFYAAKLGAGDASSHA